ncbi:unnamed protein product [Owenia fusiformis]|uniref:E3 ubiquitin-protein ligase HUWE1 n=1 Tax=Owenia fusiformis TaxID=6347 RepID=A0A8S4NMW0_OWEFU|nr:unnamed protein product [Owenia fusiformis]
MKIDRSKLKKSTSEVPADCKGLIEKLKKCSEDELLGEIKHVKSWTFGKCELFHWADVLDKFDEVLEKACRLESPLHWSLPCDNTGNAKLKEILLHVLQFTSLLIEHSFSRHLYNSMEHLTSLMSSSDMTVVLAVLNLLYVFSKRSNFITRLPADKKQGLIVRLTHLAESWGGKENGFGLAECCQDLPLNTYPSSATTLHFEYYAETQEEKSAKKQVANVISSIHIENVDKLGKTPAEIMEDILLNSKVPENKKMLVFTHIRLAHSFSNYAKRVQCVQARLQAISILVYSSAIQENVNTLLYTGLIYELKDILEVNDPKLMEIKAASLRTLTSIIHLDRTSQLTAIIESTGASSYHGYLPVLVRDCIHHMTDPNKEPFPQPFATALFSFLYHLASYEPGGDSLVSCGMMESLLQVINWYAEGQEHITFVTRAVRVVDLITNLDMQAFQTYQGLNAFINRLEHEVEICRKDQPFVIKPKRSESMTSTGSNPNSPAVQEDMETDQSNSPAPLPSTSSEQPEAATVSNPGPSSVLSSGNDASSVAPPDYSAAKTSMQCFPQRAALLKSMLNFLKKAIPDPSFSDSIRHLMDGSLPRSLKHIISNAEYYGASLFLLATDVVTVYVFQEPSLLSSLQDNGLTDVVLHALLIKDVPATREVLASLPNVFSALCLNARGLESFVQCKPFDRLFKVLLSQDYLPAMRRRRNSDPLGDTASNLGNAMDELMRHQPSLRTDATKAIIMLLEEVCAMGTNPRYVCQKPTPKIEQILSTRSAADGASSDDEEDEEDLGMTSQRTSAKPMELNTPEVDSQETIAIPLMDYVLNVMKFVEAILSNNTTDDHCREFVNQKGLIPLMKILNLPNLPIDFPASPSCIAVAGVCKSILTLSHEPEVLKQGLIHLKDVLDSLQPLHKFLDAPGGSVLLRELASSMANNPEGPLTAASAPLLHALTSSHAYIMMFVHVCRVGQSDIRSISVNHWGSDLGLEVLKGLSQLYTSLVWESTVLLAFCSEEILPEGCDFGRADMEKLLPKDVRDKIAKEHNLKSATGEMGSNGVSVAMESLTTAESPPGAPMDTSEASSPTSTPTPSTTPHQDSTEAAPTGLESSGSMLDIVDTKKSKISPVLQAQIKQIKPLLSASSRLGRALAELFGLLVKLSVGSPVRQRRAHQIPPAPTAPTPQARAVATSLTKLLAEGLSWQPPTCSPVPRLKLTFYICSVGFTSPLLFDEKKFPYHLMLQKFISSSGQDALFEAFYAALTCGGTVAPSEGLENSALPDGSGEFLDAWLMLMEKMVNTKQVLESPHTLPSKSTHPGFVPFSGLQYLASTHKAAFNAVMNLWNKKPLKVYGGRMSESILAILCHIIKGENTIKEKLTKEREESKPPVSTGTSTTSTASSSSSSTAPTNLTTSVSTSTSSAGLGGSGLVGSAGAALLGAASSLGPFIDAIISQPGASISGANLGGAGPSSSSNNSNNEAAPSSVQSSVPPIEASSITGNTSESSSSNITPSTTPNAASTTPAINEDHLQQLMDMGFSREHALEALRRSQSLESATDYCLTHPPPAAREEQELSEEEQMLRAIAMSLGENVLMDQTPPPEAETTDAVPVDVPVPVSAPVQQEAPPAEQQMTEEQARIQEEQERARLEEEYKRKEEVERKLKEERKKLEEDTKRLEEEREKWKEEKRKLEEEKKKQQEEAARDVQRQEDPLDKETLDKFTEDILPGCMNLLDTLPETVYRVCDLLVVVTQRNGSSWFNEMIITLVLQTSELALKLMEAAQPMTMSDQRTVEEWTGQLGSMPESAKLATRLHLLSLLFEEMKMVCADRVEESGVMDLFVRLLDVTQQCLSAGKNPPTPKWMPVLLLLIDEFERAAVMSKRKQELSKIMTKSRTWKWFDDRSGRWCNYSISNNKTIDDSYFNGDSSIRFTAGRRRYTVQFTTMVQVNEETGNRRPIMLALPTKEEKEREKARKELDKDEKDAKERLKKISPTDDSKVESKMDTDVSEEPPQVEPIRGLMPDQLASIVRTAVGLISIPVDTDTVHATMRLLLRITRDHSYALQFAELGGHKLLLSLTQASAFQGFTSLATLLLRHILEDNVNLKYTMEKVVRSSTNGTGSSVTGVAQGSIGSKEFHYIMKLLAPAACRDTTLFQEVVKAQLRISLPPPSKRDEDDSRFTGPNAPQVLKALPLKQTGAPNMEGVVRDVIHDLLNTLVVKYDSGEEEESKALVLDSTPGQTLAELGDILNDVIGSHVPRSIVRQGSADNLQQEDDSVLPTRGLIRPSLQPGTQGSSSDKKDEEKEESEEERKKKEEEKRKSKPLLPKSAILRLLAELVRSYAGCALLVAQYSYNVGQSDIITEDTNVLAFIFDHLLPSCQKSGDKDCPALSRLLISSLASSNHCPEAQTVLVNEVKSALPRALNLPESAEKHSRIQCLTGIISTMIESCPVPGQVPNQVFKGQQNTMNNMVKIMLKRGIVSDLARIPHSLDLSSPNMCLTVNASLKPLETLSRIVNQPQNVVQKPNHKSKTNVAEEARSDNTVNETRENNPPPDVTETASTQEQEVRTQQQAEAEQPVASSQATTVSTTESQPIEDPSLAVVAEDTEHTAPQVQDSGVSDDHIRVENELEHVLDQLIDNRRQNRNAQLECILMEDDDVVDQENDNVILDVAGDDEDDAHDSQMITQDISDDDMPEHTQADQEDDDSNSDEDDDDDDDDGPEDDEENDNDEDDDDVEEEDDDDEGDDYSEGSDMEGIDLEGMDDDYLDMEETMVRMNDDDDLFVQLEDMFPAHVPSQHLIFGDAHHLRTYNLPISVHDDNNGNELAGPSVPPPPSNVLSSHPLLNRNSDAQGSSSSSRPSAQVRRQRGGTYRYNPSTQTLHVHYTAGGHRHPNPPVILQRLLGPSAAADVLNLSSQVGHLGNAHARDAFGEATGNGSAVLGSIPNALGRWMEESRVLDGNSMHDAVTILKPDLLGDLEKHRDSELADRKEKRKKTEGEEASKKEKDGKDAAQKADTTIEWSSPNSTAQTQSTAAAATSSPFEQSATSSALTAVSNALNSLASLLPSANPTIQARSTESAAESLATAIVESVLSTSTSAATTVSSSAGALQGAPLMTSSVDPTLLQTPASLIPQTTPAAPQIAQHLDEQIAPTPAMANLQPMETPYLRSEVLETPMETDARGANANTQPIDFSSIPLPPATQGVSGVTSGWSSTDTIEQTQQVFADAVEEATSRVFNPLITPEPSSFTSSGDAVTIHSTGSSSETPSTGDESSDQPVSSTDSVMSTATTSVSQSTGTVTSTTALVTTTSSVTASTSSGAGSSTGQSGGDLPEGVDPSFLAALPESIRQEVIAEQLRLQRIQERAQEQNRQAGEQGAGIGEVNAEFLAALPPSIQEEVLAQQRAEQARLQATAAPPNPETPVDPASVLASLPPSLRQQVLADMDDSMVAVLPAELAAEAQSLRRDLEERHRRLMQDRLFASAGAGQLSAILRHSGLAGRLGTRHTIRVPTRHGTQWTWGNRGGQGSQAANAAALRLRGRHLLDHEALTCLLVLLFVNEPRLNKIRLQRVFRNLCYHTATRQWLIQALLSILHRTSECKVEGEIAAVETAGPTTGKVSDRLKKKSSQSSQHVGGAASQSNSQEASVPGASWMDSRSGQQSWLSVSLDAALGCRTNVFQIQRNSTAHGRKSSSNLNCNTSVSIHHQASPMVCNHVLEVLMTLAKTFPNEFLPQFNNKAKEATCDGDKGDKGEKDSDHNKSRSNQSSPAKAAKHDKSTTEQRDSSKTDLTTGTDFWDLLVKLDQISTSKKGKGIQKTHSNSPSETDMSVTNFESSPVGQLMMMLSHPVMKRNQELTDKLLRLLSLSAMGIYDYIQKYLPSTASSTTTTATNTTSIANNTGASNTQTTSTTTSTGTITSAVAASPLIAQELTQGDLNETMDTSSPPTDNLTSTPVPNKPPKELDQQQEEEKRKKDEEEKRKKEEQAKLKAELERPVLEAQLPLAVQVLTSKSCSDGGLEDATNLLLQISRSNNATRDSVLHLLIGGAKDLGCTVCVHIRALLSELIELNSKVKGEGEEGDEDGVNQQQPQKGIIPDRYTGTSTVVATPGKMKVGSELHLPSMSLLTSNTSSQQFLLRILKVIIQLREQAKLAAKKTKKSELREISDAMAVIEADLDEDQMLEYQASTSGPPPGGSTGSGGAPSSSSVDSPMDVDQPGSSGLQEQPKVSSKTDIENVLPRLSEQLALEELWDSLGECLTELGRTKDHHAVLVLQPAVEAFFLVHAGEKDPNKPKDNEQQKREDLLTHLNVDMSAPLSPAMSSSIDNLGALTRENSVVSVSSMANLPPDTLKFLRFAETHRTVLNQILRQSTTPLSKGPFSVLVDHTRILDFDVKRRYFRQELERMDEGIRREDLAVHIRRDMVFEDSFRELHRRNADEWKHRFYIVFEGEEGQDAGGLLREWYIIISREIFNPMYALFATSPGDRVTYTVNPLSHCNSNHLSYFKFVGRIIAKAIYDNKLLECYFTRSFYKHILGIPVKYTDMESEDYSFYQGLVYLLANDISKLGYDLDFSTEIQEFGVNETRDLKPNGRSVPVTEETKREYVKLVCQERMTGAIRKQLSAFLEGFYDIIPKRLVSIFNEQELELLISGLPTIDIEDLKSQTEYHKYQANSLQIQWFWRALRSFNQTERANFLQFVTGSSKVPLQGFSHLEGMNGIQKFQIHRDDRSTDRLPCAHTCFNQLDLPAYETYDKLRFMLLTATSECSEGFGLA